MIYDALLVFIVLGKTQSGINKISFAAHFEEQTQMANLSSLRHCHEEEIQENCIRNCARN